MISIEEAYDFLRDRIQPLPTEEVPLLGLVGRVLVEDAISDVDSPPHDKSMMDGFAIRSQDLNGREKVFNVVETVIAGSQPMRPLGENETTRIMTGAPVPENADAVIMVELSRPSTEAGEDAVSFDLDSIKPEHHLLRRGRNFKQLETMFGKGTVVRPHDIGLLAEIGIAKMNVCRRPTVAVIPTGDELVDAGQKPTGAQIRNSNSPMVTAMCQSMGLEATELGIGRDNEAALTVLVKQGLERDVLILSGGVSAGQKDLVPDILKSLGVEQVFHKVKVKPGKPIWFGERKSTTGGSPTFVFGLPGNPVSSLIGFQLFAKGALMGLMGATIEHPRAIIGQLAVTHQTRGNRPTYWPGVLERQPLTTKSIIEPAKIHPLNWNGSSDLRALGQADGLICFAADSLDHPAGERVRFLPF